MGMAVSLSHRMQAVADMVTPGSRVVDIGCDHGYVSMYLVQYQKAEHVLAMDINEGPLLRAAQHVKEAKLQSYITLRLSDGLCKFVKGEADTLICAGMGGRLIQRILEKEPDKTDSLKELILQPQSEVSLFRHFLSDKGYSIAAENMILEEGKFYPVIKAVKTGESRILSETEERFGPILLMQRHPVLKRYLAFEWEKVMKLEKKLMSLKESGRILERLTDVRREMTFVKQAAEITGIELPGGTEERTSESWLQSQLTGKRNNIPKERFMKKL